MKAQLTAITWSKLASDYRLFVRWGHDKINGKIVKGEIYSIEVPSLGCIGKIKLNTFNPLRPLYIIELDDSILD